MRLHSRSPRPSRSPALNPARLRVDPRRYSRCFPKLKREILLATAYTALILVALRFQRDLWPLLLVVAPLVGPFLRRAANVRRHFDEGDVNAAKVLDPKAGLIACFADLGTHPGAFFPTVRLLHYPIDEMAGGPFSSGDDLPAVSVYVGTAGGHKWDAFNPIPAACVTSDAGEIARLREAVPEWQWMFLNEALFRVPRPYLPGLYPVGELTIADVLER